MGTTHTKAQLEAIIAELGTKIATLEQAQVQDIKPANKTARKPKAQTKAQKATKKLRLANLAAGRMSTAKYQCTCGTCFFKPESGAKHMARKGAGHEVTTLKA